LVWGHGADHCLGPNWAGGRGDCQLPVISLGANWVGARDGKPIEEKRLSA
jgi:hypothetical protein